MRWLAVVLAALATLAACGTNQPETGSSGDGAPAVTGTDLVITVVTDADSDAEPTVMTLTCDPPGGDHPNGAAACASLAAAGRSIFDPVPADQPCTEIYGGPQVATVTGVFDGVEVDASFTRSDGCEINRWDTLGTEVFDVPML